MFEINSGFTTSIGIAFDIIGAFFLAESFLLKKTERIVKEASSFYDGNPFLLPSFIIQRIEARTGFVYLLLGFSLQFIANTDFIKQGRDINLWFIIIGSIALWLVSFLIVKICGKKFAQRTLIDKDGANFLRSLKEIKKENNERYLKLAHFYGEALDISQGRDEKDSSYAKRLIKIIENKLRIQSKK